MMSATDNVSAAVALGVEGVSVDQFQQQQQQPSSASSAPLGLVVGRKRGPPSAFQQLQSLMAQSSGTEARLLEPDSDLDGAESDDDDDEDDDDGAATGDSESPTTIAHVHAAMGVVAASAAGDVPHHSSGGRRMRLTLGQKREVVDLAASKKFTHRELAEQFHVGRTTITNICRQEELIRTETDSADAIKKKRKTTKFAYDMRVLDECLHKWRMEVKVSSPDTKITGSVLQQKAMDLAVKILQEPSAQLPEKVRHALGKFTASNGWLDGYRMRFGSFSSKVVVGGGSGDQSVIKNVDTQTRLRELHHSLAGVALQDIWAMSEFAIIHKPTAAGQSPSHDTLSLSSALSLSSSGVRECPSSGRYTLSLLVSAAGETFDLQVIGTERTPPLVPESADLQQLYRIQYGHSKTGCQVAHTTVAYLKSLNALAKARKRTFRVVLDSAVPHVKAAMILDSQGDQRTFFVYDQLQLFFLPPNFKPPRFHPCHLGVIQAFKARFRYEMVETLFAAYRHALLQPLPPLSASSSSLDPSTSSGFHPTRFLHTRNVFHWFHVALQSLPTRLVQNCWVNSGLLPTQALVALNMKDILAANTSHPLAAATAPGLPNPSVLYRDLQLLLNDVLHLAPDFLHWIGVVDPLNAQAFAELEANASVTDPGVDEAQIIRSVLQKNDFLLSKTPGETLRGVGHTEPGLLPDLAACEQCPRPDEVLASIEVLKRYLRLSKDSVANRADAVVHLNAVKSTLSSSAVHNV